jgi:hypothetical protein
MLADYRQQLRRSSVTIRTPIATAAALIAVLVLPTAATASTATSNTSLTLNGGLLDWGTAPSVGNFPSTTITGSPITVHASDNDWTVNDARGSSTGWNVTVQASEFTAGGGTPHTLATAPCH